MIKPAPQRDEVAERALERLRDVVYLVLNAVRMRRRSRAFGSFSKREKDSWLHDAQRRVRLHDIVRASRKDHDLKEPSSLALTASQIHHRSLSELHEDDFLATADSLLNDYVELREWFFEGPAFEAWQTGGSWYMQCFGEPRSGKVSSGIADY